MLRLARSLRSLFEQFKLNVRYRRQERKDGQITQWHAQRLRGLLHEGE